MNLASILETSSDLSADAFPISWRNASYSSIRMTGFVPRREPSGAVSSLQRRLESLMTASAASASVISLSMKRPKVLDVPRLIHSEAHTLTRHLVHAALIGHLVHSGLLVLLRFVLPLPGLIPTGAETAAPENSGEERGETEEESGTVVIGEAGERTILGGADTEDVEAPSRDAETDAAERNL